MRQLFLSVKASSQTFSSISCAAGALLTALCGDISLYHNGRPNIAAANEEKSCCSMIKLLPKLPSNQFGGRFSRY
jgi:hypothetical protein